MNITFKSPTCPLFLWAALLAILLASNVFAADFQVHDSQLKKCLLQIANDKQWSQPKDFTEIKCHSKNIQSLVGLEQFANVEVLSIYNNQLKQIDINLEHLHNLKALNLSRNNLTHVAITGLKKLQTIALFSNRIETLNLNNLPNLHLLKANNNVIETFHYSNTPRLKKIYIFNNRLETINIYDLPTLQYMDCRENPMPDELYDEMDRMDAITFLHDGNAEDW